MKKYDFNTMYEWPLPARIVVWGIVCAVALYLGYFLDLSSLLRLTKIAKAQENDVKVQVQAAIYKQLSLESELAQLPAQQKMLINWQKKLIKFSDLPELLNEILKTGSANQLQFSLFNPGAQVKQADYFKVPIKLVVKGTYHQIASFVSQVANMPWIVVVNDFTITRETAEDKSTVAAEILNADITLEIYYLASK